MEPSPTTKSLTHVWIILYPICYVYIWSWMVGMYNLLFMNVKTKSTLIARENFGIGQQINVLIARENNGIETINI